MEATAASLAAHFTAHGTSKFAEALLSAIAGITVQRYGADAGARLGRVEPVVRRLVEGRIHDVTTVGRGRQFAPSYMEGLAPNQPFHDPASHPWCAQLAAHAAAIRAELLVQGTTGDMWRPAAKGACARMSAPDWRIITLATWGVWVAGARFPATRAALSSLSGVKLYDVLFAKMPPRTEIGPHSDNMNFVLTAHLGLELEEGLCELSVGELTRLWREGEVLLFDTSYIHSAFNRSGRDRYILVGRFWHPGVSEEERYALLALLALMDRVRAQGGAAALFQASHETHGPFAGARGAKEGG